MIELVLLGVKIDLVQEVSVMVLKEFRGNRCLPIWIGQSEANSIADAERKVEHPRPLTHDLFAATIHAFQKNLEYILIKNLEDGVFYAYIVFEDEISLSARPSDAVALAVRLGSRIFVAEEVLSEAGVELPQITEMYEDIEVEKFKDFLDSVSPEDFS